MCPLQELQEQKDEVRQLELEARRPNQEDSPLTRNIRMLENRLDKAMIKYNEAQSIRKTYEQIVKRLREERIGFDSQLGALERTMQAKTRDYEELLLLSGTLLLCHDPLSYIYIYLDGRARVSKALTPGCNVGFHYSVFLSYRTIPHPPYFFLGWPLT